MSNKPSSEFIANMRNFVEEAIMDTLEENKALLAVGFEDAFIGATRGSNVVAVYDYDECVKVLMDRDGMSIQDAVEFMEYNVVGSYVGEKTPIFINRK